MSPSKSVKICLAVVASLTICITLFGMGNSEDYDNIISSYQKSTQDYGRYTVSQATSNIGDDNTVGLPDPSTPGITPDLDNFLSVCDYVHKSWGAAGFRYGWGEYRTYTDPQGNSYNVRIDCSGYTSFCLFTMGWTDNPTYGSSDADFGPCGFEKIYPANGTFSIEELQAGDLLTWPGHHIQIYAGDELNYNWGSNQSLCPMYDGVTDFSTVESRKPFGTTNTVSNMSYLWRKVN